jgi:hypothetical protein
MNVYLIAEVPVNQRRDISQNYFCFEAFRGRVRNISKKID